MGQERGVRGAWGGRQREQKSERNREGRREEGGKERKIRTQAQVCLRLKIPQKAARCKATNYSCEKRPAKETCETLKTYSLERRVPGLPIRDCARGCNSRAHTRPQLSAVDVTGKTFSERLYLVLGLRKFAP